MLITFLDIYVYRSFLILFNEIQYKFAIKRASIKLKTDVQF